MKIRVLILGQHKSLAEVIASSTDFEVRSEQTKPGLLGILEFAEVIIKPIRKLIASFQSKKTLALLRDYQPAIVIVTDPISAAIMSYFKDVGLYIGKVAVIYKDFTFDARNIFEEVDAYICSITEQAETLVSHGVASEKIFLVSSWIDKKFYETIDREVACREAGLLTTMQTILVAKGDTSIEQTKELLVNLYRSPKTYQIAVLCGSEILKKELAAISAPDRHPAKFYSDESMLENLLSASSVAIIESLQYLYPAAAKKVPVVLHNVPHTEAKHNISYLTNNRVADFGRISREAVFLAEQVLEGRAQRNWQEIESKILKPSGSMSIFEALDRIKPAAQPIAVKNYQND